MRRTVLVPTMLVAMSLTALLVLALTLAAPLAAQEETTAQPDSEAQTVSKDKDAPSGEPEQSAQEGGKQAESAPVEEAGAATAARATDSLQEAAVTIESDDNGTVERIEIAAADCAIEKGATVTVADGDGNEQTFTNIGDVVAEGAANIEATEDQILVTDIEDDLNNGFGTSNTGEVTDSSGITCGRDDDGGSEGGNESGNGGEEANEAPGQNDSDDGNCADAKVVERLSGTGDQQSPRFSTTGDSFRVTSEVDATDQRLLVYSVTVNDENGDFVTSIDQEEEGTNASFVNADPGTYFLDIISANANYTITVEDCASVGSSGNGGEIVNDPGGNLPDTGGLSLIGLAVLGIVSAAACLSVVRGGRR